MVAVHTTRLSTEENVEHDKRLFTQIAFYSVYFRRNVRRTEASLRRKRQALLDLGNRQRRIQTLWTRTAAIEDSMTTI